MPSDKSTVATKADFVPKVVGKTDRDPSFSSVLAHDERSQQPRPEVHGTQLNVLSDVLLFDLQLQPRQNFSPLLATGT